MGSPVQASNSGGLPAVVATVTGGGDGVLAASDTGNGVSGATGAGNGVSGLATTTGIGISGRAQTGYGIYGYSASSNGVRGETGTIQHAAVSGYNANGGPAIFGQSTGDAGAFDGNVSVTGKVSVTGNVTATGDITASGTVKGNTAEITGHLNATKINLSGNLSASDVILSGADCAEEFDLLEGAGIEPGSVVVFADGGTVSTSAIPYNKCVAGVISGAGSYKPGVILDRRASSAGRAPIALVGKVFCKVDAAYGEIEVGDPLTTSPSAGHAMKVSDPALAFGAVIGKALASHKQGSGLIPILVSLQ